MIEVLKYKTISKNTLEAMVDIKIPKWGNFIIREVGYFKKDGKRWIALPSKSYQDKDGNQKYYLLNLFEEPSMMQTFSEKVMEAIDLYLSKPPEQEQQLGIPF